MTSTSTTTAAAASAASPTVTPTSPAAAPKPARYIIEGVLPAREVSILSGASGAGKTTLIVQMLAAIQAGEVGWFGHPINYPVKLAYVAADRTWESYEELASRAGLDLATIQVRSLVDDATIDLNRLERDSMRLLHDLIRSFASPTLVVVDPMVVFLGIDPNRYNLVAPRLIQLGRWCRQYGLTILATHHATKARTDYSFKRPQDRISGSSALLGFTSSQLFLSAPDEIGKPYAEFAAVNHNAPAEQVKLARNAAGLFVPFEAEAARRSPLAARVMKAVEGRVVDRHAIQATTRIDPATLDTLLDHLAAAEMIKAVGGGEFTRPSPVLGGPRPVQ